MTYMSRSNVNAQVDMLLLLKLCAPMMLNQSWLILSCYINKLYKCMNFNFVVLELKANQGLTIERIFYHNLIHGNINTLVNFCSSLYGGK